MNMPNSESNKKVSPAKRSPFQSKVLHHTTRATLVGRIYSKQSLDEKNHIDFQRIRSFRDLFGSICRNCFTLEAFPDAVEWSSNSWNELGKIPVQGSMSETRNKAFKGNAKVFT